MTASSIDFRYKITLLDTSADRIEIDYWIPGQEGIVQHRAIAFPFQAQDYATELEADTALKEYVVRNCPIYILNKQTGAHYDYQDEVDVIVDVTAAEYDLIAFGPAPVLTGYYYYNTTGFTELHTDAEWEAFLALAETDSNAKRFMSQLANLGGVNFSNAARRADMQAAKDAGVYSGQPRVVEIVGAGL